MQLRTLGVLLFAALALCGLSRAGEAADLDLFLFIGQSNMASRAPIGKDDTGKLDGVLLLNKENKWEPAAFAVLPGNEKMGVQGYNRYSALEVQGKQNGFSSAYTFTQALLKQNPQAKPGLILNAIGGTSIAQWKKGAKDGFFDSTVARTKIAQQSGKLRAILWHQGESDANSKSYLQDLKAFVADLRTALGVSEKEVPFLAGQLLPCEKFAAFNANILTIAEVVPNAGCITSEGASDKGDKLHFNAESQKQLGERYAQLYLKLSAGGAK